MGNYECFLEGRDSIDFLREENEFRMMKEHGLIEWVNEDKLK